MRYYYDITRKLIIYPELVDTGLPDAKQVNGHTVVSATLPNLQALARAGLPVLPPLHDYAWPRPDTWKALEADNPALITAERTTANFICLNPRCFVFNEQRTGKTPASLWAADWLMDYWRSKGCDFSVLVLCTKSNLYTWRRHIDLLFNRQRSVRLLTGSSARRISELGKSADFYICNHDGLQIAAPDRLPSNIQMLICDEATAYKHADTKRSGHLQSVAASVPYVCVMSGSPTPEGPINAYGLAKLIGRTGRESHHAFKQRIMFRVSEFRWAYYSHAQAAAVELLSPAICFRQSDVFKARVRMPPERKLAPLNAEQKRLIKELEANLITQLENGQCIAAINEGSLRWKLLQIVSGVVYSKALKPHPNKPNTQIEYSVHHELGANERVQAVRDVLDECGGRAVIYAPLSGVIKMLTRELKRYKPAVINGETSAKERDRIVHKFNQHQIGPIIGDPSAMAHGLDLARGASTIIWWAPVDKWEVWAQANERIEGVNQHAPTQQIHMYSTSIELEMYRRLITKATMQGVIVDMIRHSDANRKNQTAIYEVD